MEKVLCQIFTLFLLLFILSATAVSFHNFCLFHILISFQKSHKIWSKIKIIYHFGHGRAMYHSLWRTLQYSQLFHMLLKNWILLVYNFVIIYSFTYLFYLFWGSVILLDTLLELCLKFKVRICDWMLLGFHFVIRNVIALNSWTFITRNILEIIIMRKENWICFEITFSNFNLRIKVFSYLFTFLNNIQSNLVNTK